MHRRILTWTALLLIAATAGAENIDLILRAGGLTSSAPPLLIGSEVLLSYEFEQESRIGAIHAVQAAFSHEAFGTLHTFKRNQNGIFVLSIPKSWDTDEITYRLVVDGIWTTDPANPDTVADPWGVPMSRFALPAVPSMTTTSPLILGDGTVEFAIEARGGQTITIVGSFNGWDPYMTKMSETSTGVYKRRLRLPTGEHLYYFMINGLRVPDPRNERQRLHNDGLVLSVVEL